MTYLFSQLCLWIILAFVVGLIVGWLTFSRRARGRLGWLRLGGVLFVLGVIVAVLKWVPDVPGFWLEAALFLFAAYIIGCPIGSWLHGAFGAKPVADEAQMKPLPVAAPPSTPVAEPAVTPAPDPVYPGTKPQAMPTPAQGGADDLKRIRGIGPKNEKILNDLGVYRFCQIGAWSAANAEWVGHYIAFPGRIERERWIEQGKLLCAGVETDYARQVRTGSVVVDDKADAALTEEEAATLERQLPQAAATVENEDTYGGARPFGLGQPLSGTGDDLKLIKGIGHKNEGLLHGLGIWHFSQIASWTEENALWIGSYLAFPGRIEREEWVDQAKVLAAGGITEFAKRVKDGEVESSTDDGSHGQDNVTKVDVKP